MSAVGAGAPAADALTGQTQEMLMRVVVAVLTFRRESELAGLLPLLAGQGEACDDAVRIVVIDNDPAASARSTVAALDLMSTTYVSEPRPGIAFARNRALLEAAQDDLLIFIDDDERPMQGWLAALLSMWRRHECTAVVGPVVSQFEAPLSPWLEAGGFFDRLRPPTGTCLDVAATNNMLLDLRQVRAYGVLFDERFGISGGSDTLFTRQLRAQGAVMMWCDEALVIDRVPRSRLTVAWVLLRALRSGNAWARTSLEMSDGPRGRLRARGLMLILGSLRLAGGSLRALVGLLQNSQSDQARGCRTAARGLGMLGGACGYVRYEYSR